MSMRRLASLAVAAASTAILVLPGSALAAGNGNTGHYLCTNSFLPAQCADLLNNNATTAQHIILDSSTLGQGLGWNEAAQGTVTETWPFKLGIGLNNRYVNDTVYEIQKKTPGGHNGCMGILPNGQTWEVVWEPCDGNEGNELNWVLSPEGYLVNVGVSDSNSTGANSQPWGLSDQVNGTSNGSELTVSNDDNPWYYIAAP